MRLHINSLGRVPTIYSIDKDFNLERGMNEEVASVEEEEVDVAAIDVRFSGVAVFITSILSVCSNGFKLHLYSSSFSRYGKRGMDVSLRHTEIYKLERRGNEGSE